MEKRMEKNEKIISEILSKSVVVGISSEEVSLVKSLVENKCKDKTLFVCEGLWAVDKLIEKDFEVCSFFFSSDKLSSKNMSDEEIAKIAKMVNYASKSYAISEKSCKKISDRDGFDEFFVVARLKNYSLSDIERIIKGKDNVLAIVMDGLEQPGNIGAILRSFDCAGGDFAIVTNKKARLSNSRLVRSSLGASFMIPVLEAEIEEVQAWLLKNKFKNVVTDLRAKKSYRDIDYSGRIAVVSGNEHTGISSSWREQPNSESIIIPMLGSCESLNVGFASTLVSYEAGLKKFKNVKY